MSKLDRRRRERGESVLEIAAWLAGIGCVVAVAGYILVAKPFETSATRVSAAQQAYVQAVATQQGNAYIVAVATQAAQNAERVDEYLRAAVAADDAKSKAATAPVRRSPTPILPAALEPSAPPAPRLTQPVQPSPVATPPPATSAVPAPAPTAVKQLTRDDLIDYAYSLGCNGDECTCVADTLLQHFTLDQISRQGIAASGAMIAEDLWHNCFDPRGKPASMLP